MKFLGGERWSPRWLAYAFATYTRTGAMPFSRSLREGGAFSWHRGGGPPDTRQAAHDDALSSGIQFRPQLIVRSNGAGLGPKWKCTQISFVGRPRFAMACTASG